MRSRCNPLPALTGIAVTGIMRYVLFLAILGVVASGVIIDTSSQAANPAGQAFRSAAGDLGFRLFGIIFWAAAITSVIGAAYTSVSFLPVFKQDMSERARNIATVIFIAVSLVAYGAFALACVSGVMYLAQERQLKTHHLRSIFYRLPPIHDLAVANRRLIFSGFAGASAQRYSPMSAEKIRILADVW